jgi:hypothetical protein
VRVKIQVPGKESLQTELETFDEERNKIGVTGYAMSPKGSCIEGLASMQHCSKVGPLELSGS